MGVELGENILMNLNYTVTFVCYNQLDYTKQFIASLDPSEVDFSRIVAVDNGSTDGTREWLQQQGFGAVVLNDRNLGCGAAWNQGALAIQSKWTVVMNNDVICAKGWLRNLLAIAEANDLQIASPAMIEGDLNYDLLSWVNKAQLTMQGYIRKGAQHAVCMVIRDDVWEKIGYFMPVPKLMGYEDRIFFLRAKEARLKTGICANSWLHHFGMTTQNAVKLDMKMDANQDLGNRSLMKRHLHQSWLSRKLAAYVQGKFLTNAVKNEQTLFGCTVHGIRTDDDFEWK
jgi:GT2 family glycosyltransferase